MEQWHEIVKEEELKPGEHIVKLIHGHPIAIYNLEGEFYAIEDICSHQAMPLSEGPVEGDVITCPFHGAKFCIKTGAVMAPPAFEDILTFEVRVHEGIIQVKL